MASMTTPSDFRLCRTADGRNVACDARGAFAGTIPLLQRYRHPVAGEFWAPRPADELNADMSQRYGFPIDMTAKLDALTNVAQALNRGDVFRAQLGTHELKLPELPPAGGALPSGNQAAWLAMMLHASGMLNQGAAGFRNPPSAPANSNLVSGQISSPLPANQNWPLSRPDVHGRLAGDGGLPITPVQEVLPFPPIPWIETFPIPPAEAIPFRPLPGEIAPPPFDVPNRLGPYEHPDEDWPFSESEECKEEVDAAHVYCRQHVKKLKSGLQTGNFGNTVIQCMRGMVSEKCGGNPVRPEA